VNEFLRIALPYFLYELFLLVLFGLVGVSALISGAFALFRQSSDMWFMASPRFQSVLVSKALQVGVFSLWPLVVIALPLLVAMQVVYDIGVWGMVIGMLAVVSMGVLTSVAALVWLLCLGYLSVAASRRMPRGDAFGIFLSSVVLTIVVAGLLVWLPLRDFDLYSLFAVRDFSITEAPTTYIASQFQYYLSHLAATAFYAVQTGAMVVAWQAVGWLVALAVGVTVLYSFLGRGFLHIWQLLQESHFVAASNSETKRPVSNQFSRIHSTWGALVRREILVFFRTPRDVFWLGFLLLLWLVITSFDVFLVENVARSSAAAESASQWIQAAQFLVITYFAAAIALRFAFPSFSIERDHVWVLLSSPMSLQRLFAAKALVYVGGIVALTLVVTMIHLWILPSTGVNAGWFVCFGLIASATVALVGLGIGARFPNFASDDPQQMSTSVPGLVFMLIVIGYSSLSAYALFSLLTTQNLLFAGAFAVGSLIMVWLVYTLVVQRLQQVEFVPITHS
jgi:ABC-2 type transport system permease protein